MEIPDTVEGKSLVPAFSDPTEKIRDTLHFAYRGVQRAVKKEEMKLIEYVVDGKRATQLFDLSADPLEMRNLAELEEYTEVLGEMRAELKRWPEEFGDTGIVGNVFWSDFEKTEKLGEWRPGSRVHE